MSGYRNSDPEEAEEEVVLVVVDTGSEASTIIPAETLFRGGGAPTTIV